MIFAADQQNKRFSCASVQWRQAVQLPWAPVLSELQLKRGLAYYGGGQRMERVAAALMAGQPITAVSVRVVGGVRAAQDLTP